MVEIVERISVSLYGLMLLGLCLWPLAHGRVRAHDESMMVAGVVVGAALLVSGLRQRRNLRWWERSDAFAGVTAMMARGLGYMAGLVVNGVTKIRAQWAAREQ